MFLLSITILCVSITLSLILSRLKLYFYLCFSHYLLGVNLTSLKVTFKSQNKDLIDSVLAFKEKNYHYKRMNVFDICKIYICYICVLQIFFAA